MFLVGRATLGGHPLFGGGGGGGGGEQAEDVLLFNSMVDPFISLHVHEL